MDLLGKLKEQKAEFESLCHAHDVDKLFLFGSLVSGGFDPSRSDVDVVVTVAVNDPVKRGEKLLSLWDGLEAFFERRVDLLTEDSIRNPYLKSSIERTKVLVYDRTREKIPV